MRKQRLRRGPPEKTQTWTTRKTELQKRANRANQLVQFFSAGANFRAILGHFWAILGHLPKG